MGMFDDAVDTPYRNRDALKDKFVPDEIVGREQEKSEYKNALRPVLNGFSPDNVFLIGPSGVGKTALTRYALDDLTSQDGMDHITVVRVNCNGMEGETTLMLALANQFRPPDDKLSTTGYKKARARDLLFNELDAVGGTVIMVLDELDTISELDTFLYQVPRAHETGKLDDDVDVGIVGISNDPRFLDELPDDVQNTLAEVEINFSGYDPGELRAVLAHRAAIAFKDTTVIQGDNGPEVDSDVLEPGAVPLAAAKARRNGGDARTGISILRNAADLARDNGCRTVTEDHVQMAVDEYHREQIHERIEKLEETARVVLYSVLTLNVEGPDESGPPRTAGVTERYQDLHDRAGGRVVSSRQVRKHLRRMENIGLVESQKQKGGGAGTFTEWLLEYPPERMMEAMSDVVSAVGVVRSVQGMADAAGD